MWSALPDGEAYKTWDSLNMIFDALLSKACDRKTVLFALGGGVVGDMTALPPACYMRGVPLRPGADHGAVAGGFVGRRQDRDQPPAGQEHDRRLLPAGAVVCDLDTLKTLPERELSPALAEVIKYGPHPRPAFLDWIEANPAGAARAIPTRWRCGAAQLRDQGRGGGAGRAQAGLRAILNFGHLRPRDRGRPGLWRVAARRGRWVAAW